MRVTALPNLESVPPDQWNLLAGDDPFLQHEFLLALERAGCVGGDSGWEPRHIALHAEGSSRLIGAVPLYLKHHSYGEYVFDWAWADAYVRSGREYYPKLVAAVPFTPATGKRLLVADTDRDEVAALLIEATREVADATGASSLHWLFPAATDLDLLTKHDLLARTGCQFHWSNPGYSDFEDFLSGMTAHKRYNIRRERRRVREADVTAEVLQGAAISSELWDVCYRFYRATIRAHGGIAYLTREFFHMIGETMANHTVLVVARQKREYVGMAFGLRNAHTYYGRYWGGRPDIPGLHFETCYYAPIEYCIAQRIGRYEAGAQGAHKLARGFVPTPTYSAHWLRDPMLRRAVADFLKREHGSVGQYMDELSEHSPFRRPAISPRASRN